MGHLELAKLIGGAKRFHPVTGGTQKVLPFLEDNSGTVSL